MAGLLWWGYAMRDHTATGKTKELLEVVGRDKISSSSWILASSPLFHKYMFLRCRIIFTNAIPHSSCESRARKLAPEALLDLGLLLGLDLGHIIPRSVVGSRHLVEGVVGMLLKLLPDPLLALVHPQTDTAAILLHLLEATLLVLGKGRGVSSLGVPVDLVLARAARQRQRIQSVVDTGGAEGTGLVVVELREIEAARLLDGCLGLLGGLAGGVGLLLGDEGILLGLLSGGFCLLGGFGLPVRHVSFA